MNRAGGSWIRVDDTLFEHRKVLGMGGLGAVAVSQFLASVAYCNRYLTDGHIPAHRAWSLVDWSGVSVAEELPSKTASTCSSKIGEVSGKSVCDALVDAGLLELCDEHPRCLVVHDYLDYQWSREDILRLRERRSEAGRLGGVRSAVSRGQAKGQASASASAAAKRQASVQAKRQAKVKQTYSSSSCIEKEKDPAGNHGLEVVGTPEPVERLWTVFQERHPRAVLTPDRRRRAQQFLRSHGEERCEAAIRGIAFSPFHMGENDEGRTYDDWEVIFRSANNVETFSGYWLDPQTRPRGRRMGRQERETRELLEAGAIDTELLRYAYPETGGQGEDS